MSTSGFPAVTRLPELSWCRFPVRTTRRVPARGGEANLASLIAAVKRPALRPAHPEPVRREPSSATISATHHPSPATSPECTNGSASNSTLQHASVAYPISPSNGRRNPTANVTSIVPNSAYQAATARPSSGVTAHTHSSPTSTGATYIATAPTSSATPNTPDSTRSSRSRGSAGGKGSATRRWRHISTGIAKGTNP